MSLRRSLLLILAACGLAGCAVRPPVASASQLCGFEKRPVETTPPARVSQHHLAEAPQAILLLSGGGEDGAFGAGLLAEWHDNAGRLPKFSTVTGVSTGAMLATFAFIDQPDVARRDYDIGKESDILRAFAKLDAHQNPTLTSFPSIASHSAFSDLAPLQATLMRDISIDLLRRVADEGASRKLYVGVVDVDSGDAVELDMTAMAAKAVASPGAFERYQRCYVDAIIASAAEPPAAPPTFIDNREYIDGGARFGVFLDDYALRAGLEKRKRVTPGAPGEPGAAAADYVAVVPRLPAPPTLFIIVNGDQKIVAQCGKLSATDCRKDGSDPYDNVDGAHKNWALLTLAERSSKALINQIYLFSVSDIYARYARTYGAGHDQLYVDDHIKYMAISDADLAVYPDSAHSCPKLWQQDRDELRVLEFHPRYMHCLIGFGAHYADVNAKALKVETDMPAAIQAVPALPPGGVH